MQLTLQKKRQRADLLTLAAVAALFLVLAALLYGGLLNRQMTNMLVPTAVYIVMAVSLNLVVGLLGELSLGHAGFMAVGAYAGGIFMKAVPAAELLKAGNTAAVIPFILIALLISAVVAGIFGIIIGIPALRLRADYFWLVGDCEELEPEATDTDRWALAHGYVAITPTNLDVTDYELLNVLKQTF